MKKYNWYDQPFVFKHKDMYIYTHKNLHTQLLLILHYSVTFRNLNDNQKPKNFGTDIWIHNSANFLLHFETTGLMLLPNVYFLIEISQRQILKTNKQKLCLSLYQDTYPFFFLEEKNGS